MSKAISNADCTKVLKNYLGDEHISVKSFELKPISENIEGFLGEHYHLLIKYEKHGQEQTEIFFIKTKPTKIKAQEEAADSLEIYKREIFFYDVLHKELKKCGFDVSFAAESYYYIKDTAIVMENLTHKGFSITDRHVNLSLDHVKLALKALALYHAGGYAYERIMAKKLGRDFKLGSEYEEYMREPFYVQYIDPDAYSMNWWRSINITFPTIIALLPDEFFDKEHFHQLQGNFETGKVFVEKTNIAKTCGHGDLWSNNMLFKHDDAGKPVDCRLVDFQIIRYFYPCFDVILVLFCNTDADFRKKHLTEMYRYYYGLLGSALKNYGFSVEEIHPWDDFMRSIKLVLADAFSQITIAKLMVNLPKEKLSNMVAEGDDGFKELMFDNSKLISDAFKADEQYRKLVIEAMREFYDTLLEKSKG